MKQNFVNVYKLMKVRPIDRIGANVPSLIKQKSAMQKLFLNRTSGVVRFKDTDKDGVVDGLDCNMYDPTKHGFIKKAANWVRGRGYREDEETAIEAEIRRRKAVEREKEPIYKRPVEAIKEKLVKKGYRKDGQLYLQRPVSRLTGYAFETKEERANLQEEDQMERVKTARQKLSIEKLRKLEKAQKQGLITEEEHDRRILSERVVQPVRKQFKPKPSKRPKLSVVSPLPYSTKQKKSQLISFMVQPKKKKSTNLKEFMI